MHLKSLRLRGFKSFPDSERLDFGPGVSVIVGPNGSGKSNVTDAVLWAMGEQSALAVRGQSMQDVIFGGARGRKQRSAAEVEIVLDNSDGTVALPLSEISICRRLDRNGEGEYRLNGARCRLGDVLEVLSDTGLGKETHSVISQGRVEAIVTSKPRDRRLLIEEAAGLGKHRKRRRRAQLKLDHTEENLDRALDVEREARAQLRPLKRQAEAAELHERLERQVLEVRWELARDAQRGARLELRAAEAQVAQARAERSAIESDLGAVSDRRARAEQAMTARVEERERLSGRLYAARAGTERLGLRVEQVRRVSEQLDGRVASAAAELATLREARSSQADPGLQGGLPASERIAGLEHELAELDRQRERQIASSLEDLAGERERAERQISQQRELLVAAQAERAQANALVEQAREQLRHAEREVDGSSREAARVGAELAAVNQFLRSYAYSVGRASSAGEGPRSLGEALDVRPGYELALAAALGGLLDAPLAKDLVSAQELLDSAGSDGAVALLAGSLGAPAEQDGEQSDWVSAGPERCGPPVAGAERLEELLEAPAAIAALAARLLRGAWVVERLEELPGDFRGIAVTRSGRAWFGHSGELRQVNEGGSERVLAQRNERTRLLTESERVAAREHGLRRQADGFCEGLLAREAGRDQAERVDREHQRELAQSNEALRLLDLKIEGRRGAPEEGPLAVRRAELQGELTAERREAERAARERAERLQRIERLAAREAADRALLPLTRRLLAAMANAAEAAARSVGELELAFAEVRAAGEGTGTELRECAALEADIQARLRAAGEIVTSAEVSAQRLRDLLSETVLELRGLAERLEIEVPSEAPSEPLAEIDVEQLQKRRGRLERRRTELGPVNPLAQEQYGQALEHVAELEGRRVDLETAMRELRGVIRDTDRQIHVVFEETFAAAAQNFNELVGDVFPGGSGRLRLVEDELARRPLLGGESPVADQVSDGDAEPGSDAEQAAAEDLQGVEIEITPAGKSSKRLSLLSGGEKAMTALAFLFAVFLARPSPFYILDEVEAALDDENLGRFLVLLRRYGERAQFIVITHQQRTMEAADWLYGVSMGGDGVSKVISRRLPPRRELPEAAEAA